MIATQALPQMIKALGWTNIAVIHTNDAYGIDYAEGLRSNALHCGLTVHTTVEFDQHNPDSIRGAVAGSRWVSLSVQRLLARLNLSRSINFRANVEVKLGAH